MPDCWFTRRARALALTAALAPVLAGCAGGPHPPAGYEHPVDHLGGAEGAPLAGRRIVLDPGHGGLFRGALGVHGLTEAEVNLGVALELARRLRERGAEVLLTRETDRDFLSPADSSLKSDLAERVRLANAFHPDLFLSIHHNADPGGSHRVNETRVYFQLGDEGPALEAAEDVQRFLARNLGIAPSRVVAGNYAVLRGSEAPALLTESSYITYPPTEKKLARAGARRIEAEALCLGIVRFFARRSPVIEDFRALSPGSPPTDSGAVTALVALRARVRGAFDGVEMKLDDVPIEPTRDGPELEWRPPSAVGPGVHEATLRVRLAAEGSSRLARVRLRIVGEPGQIVADFPGQPSWDGVQPLGLRVRVLDRAGPPILDSLRIRVRDDRTGLLEPADTTLTLRDGAAWAYFRRSPQAPRDAPRVRLIADLDPPMTGAHGLAWVPAARPALPVRPGARPPVRTGFALRMPDGVPLRDAPGTSGPGAAGRWINRDGFVHLAADTAAPAAGVRGYPDLPGYRPWATDAPWPPRLVAIAGGALHGRRVVLDPAGGGDDDAGRGPSGERGAALNLEVAHALAAMLEAAGAEVTLTRDGNAPLSDRERVRIAEAFRAERYLRIGHGAEPPRVGAYFSSVPGKRWATRLADLAASLGLPRPAVGDDAQYPIQQTSSTALYAALGRVDDPAAAAGHDPARLRLEAYALYLGLAREWVSDAAWPLDSLAVSAGDGRPVAGAVVRLGESLVLQSDPLGRVVFARTEPGPMLVEVQDSRAGARRILLDSDHAVRLTGHSDR